jgi:hypothetical protein
MEKEYFLIRWVNCSNGGTDIIGVTDDEEFAKSVCSEQPVFRKYERVKFLVKDLKDKIKEIAETYHDRLVMASMSGTNNNCQCCGKPTPTTTCIEHDSQDFTKDLWVCSDCYCAVVKYWQENRPKKIAPI